MTVAMLTVEAPETPPDAAAASVGVTGGTCVGVPCVSTLATSDSAWQPKLAKAATTHANHRAELRVRRRR